MRLLLLELDPQSTGSLAAALRHCGHLVDAFPGYEEGRMALRMVEYDLLIFDVGAAPSGVAPLLRSLPARNARTPSLVVAAAGSGVDPAKLLDLGADDHLFKPFALPELEARIRAVLRRSLAKSGDNVIGVGKLRFDLVRRCAMVGDAPLHMSPRETDLLETLMLRRGRVVTKAQIRGRLCEWSGDLSDGAIELYVYRLRRRLYGSGVRLYTLRGFGYLVGQADPARKAGAIEGRPGRK